MTPHAILDPGIRWFPADEAFRETTRDKLMPPLVPTLRKEVKALRDGGYDGGGRTRARACCNWWFDEPHLIASD